MISDAMTADESSPPVGLTPTHRAPRISQADVFGAADALLVEGHRPTIDRVRMRLGRGSPNTINDHLDAWWTKLGSRLRDLPGREFPQLPERVGQALQHLWNEALEGAHEVLQGTLSAREDAVSEHERGLEARAGQLDERDRATALRASALEESMVLAREQLTAANQRAERLESALQERDTECTRLRTRIEAQEAGSEELRAKLEAQVGAHQAERTRLEERHAAAEARWLTEVDRARQAAKDSAKEQERHVRDLRAQIDHLQLERDSLRQELRDVRSDLKTAATLKEQLEEHLRSIAKVPNPVSSTAKPKRKGSGKRGHQSPPTARATRKRGDS